jgi:hypothetical protein
MWQLVIPIEEKLYAAKAGLFRLELKSPFNVLCRFIRVVNWGTGGIMGGVIDVGDFGRNLIRCNAFGRMSISNM